MKPPLVPRTISRPPLSNEQFIRLWMECKSAREVSMRAGLRLTYVYHRARKLRKMGVSLPKHLVTFERKARHVNIDKLNRLVERMRKQGYGEPL